MCFCFISTHYNKKWLASIAMQLKCAVHNVLMKMFKMPTKENLQIQKVLKCQQNIIATPPIFLDINVVVK